jgi:hypothetical protein
MLMAEMTASGIIRLGDSALFSHRIGLYKRSRAALRAIVGADENKSNSRLMPALEPGRDWAVRHKGVAAARQRVPVSDSWPKN